MGDKQRENDQLLPLSHHLSLNNCVDQPIVIFAYDFMTVLPNNLKLAEYSIPAIRLLYQNKEASSSTNEKSLSLLNDAPNITSSGKEVMSIPGFFANVRVSCQS